MLTLLRLTIKPNIAAQTFSDRFKQSTVFLPRCGDIGKQVCAVFGQLTVFSDSTDCYDSSLSQTMESIIITIILHDNSALS